MFLFTVQCKTDVERQMEVPNLTIYWPTLVGPDYKSHCTTSQGWHWQNKLYNKCYNYSTFRSNSINTRYSWLFFVNLKIFCSKFYQNSLFITRFYSFSFKSSRFTVQHVSLIFSRDLHTPPKRTVIKYTFF